MKMEYKEFFADPVAAMSKLGKNNAQIEIVDKGKSVLLVSIVNPKVGQVLPMPVDIEHVKTDHVQLSCSIVGVGMYIVVIGVEVTLFDQLFPVYMSRHPDYISFDAQLQASRTIDRLRGIDPDAPDGEEE